MRHIYIDLGCFDGDTVMEFRNWNALAYKDVDWEIYAFDSSPDHISKWKKQTLPNIHFEHKAAWIEDGEIEFSNVVGEEAMGSTVMKEKPHWQKGTRIKVPCFDFSVWLEQFRGDHVIVKMDIEGAELPILTKMIKDGTSSIPHLMLIEWHDGKMPTFESNKSWIWENLKCRWVHFR